MSLFSKHRDDTDFMSQLEAATNLRPATPAILMFFSIVLLVILGIVWAGVSEVEQMTRGDGEVVPSREVQVVQSLEGGIVTEILTQEGALVEPGQILMRIDDVQFASKERGTEAKLLSLMAKKTRLQAEAHGKAFALPPQITEKAPQIAANEQSLYETRQRELANSFAILDDRINKASAELAEVNAQVGRLSESRRLLTRELDLTREMVQKRAVPKLEEMRIQRELSDISGQINAQSQRSRGLQSELAVAKKEKTSQTNIFQSAALEELNTVEAELAALQEDLKSIGDRVQRTEIKSPVKGIVNDIAISTIGGVVEPAMKLMEIVPVDDALKIIARVKPSDIAFIRPGQPAKVKLTAYDAQKYGALDAKLVRIGANNVKDSDGNTFFEIEVHTDRNYLGTEADPLPITPGMVAQTEIITGKQTILDYLLKPVLKARDVALTER